MEFVFKKIYHFVFQYGALFLQTCDFMLGSPTALADPDIERILFKAAHDHHGLYVPSGALWGK